MSRVETKIRRLSSKVVQAIEARVRETMGRGRRMQVLGILKREMALAVVSLWGGSVAWAEVTDVATLIEARFAETIGERSVVFYAIDLESDGHFAFQPDRVDERRTPYSTFKIPNLLIALETGVASSLEDGREWDRERRPPADYWPDTWRRDQTLESAFKRSAVWYFQDIALEVGGERYRALLRDYEYGNGEAPDGNDIFWLNGPLAISPKEQARFLERLVMGQLDLDPSMMDAIRAVSLLETVSGHRVYGKTGAGPVTPGDFDGAFEGWLVGWVERPASRPVVYALFVEGPSFQSIAEFRIEMTLGMLRVVGALPELPLCQ